MTGMSGNVPGSFQSGEIKQLLSQRMSTIGSNIDAGQTFTSSGVSSQQASATQEGQKAKQANHFTPDKAVTSGKPADQTQFSPQMQEKLIQQERLTARMKHFRDDLDTRFMSFLNIEPSSEQIKQAARFAATTIWDILKKARLAEDGEEDTDITSHLLALLMKIHSSYTFEHSERVMDWTVALAEELGIEDESELHNLGQAAFFRDLGMLGGAIADGDLGSNESLSDYLEDSRGTLMECGSLHDIGKMRIPEEILNKSAPLTEEEFAIIKTHPLIGVEIVKPYPSLHRAIPGIKHHHEKWNGTGYPDGLKNLMIPLAARIITVTDTFDAMTEDRPYRKGLSYRAAIGELLRLSGEQFDPSLVPAFIRMLVRKGEVTVEELEKDLEMDLSLVFPDED